MFDIQICEVFMNIRELMIGLFVIVFVYILAILIPLAILDRYPKGHDLGHGCVAIELGGFPYELCPLNP